MRLRIWLRCVGATLLLGACGAAGGPEDVLAEVDEADAVIASRVLVLKNLSAAGGREYAAAVKKACEPAAAACLCSRGCPTTWRGCTPSALCGLSDAATTAHAATRRTPNTTILLYLTFSRTLVRHKYRGNPMRAYRREAARIEWYLHSARRVNTTLPIHIVVGGERNTTAEARFEALGAKILPVDIIAPPPWTSTFHKASFQRLSALSFTQFEKVVVMDNDMVLLRNIDDIAAAEAPGLVFHPAAPFMLKLGERCAVTGGLFVLRPDAAEYARARRHLRGMYAGEAKPRFRYDGSDQEFWRSFYVRPVELPTRFHATQWVKLDRKQWMGVRVLHQISGFRAQDHRLPREIRRQMKHFL